MACEKVNQSRGSRKGRVHDVLLGQPGWGITDVKGERHEKNVGHRLDRLHRVGRVARLRSSKTDEGTNLLLHLGMEGRALRRRTPERGRQSAHTRLGWVE